MSTPNKKTLSDLPSEILETYIRPDSRFVSKAVSYAVEILESRGRIFSDDEKQIINKTITQKKEGEEKLTKSSNDWERNIVKDESSPKLYSRLAIYIFSILFGVYAGSILLAINCKVIINKKGFYLTIIYGILYSILQIFIIGFIEKKFNMSFTNSVTYLFSGLGAVILDYYFWNKYIGKDFNYRKKEIWLPAIIFITVYALIFYLTIIAN